MTALVFVNGIAEDSLSVTDRGVCYGDGVFETIRVSRGVPVLLDAHLERLQLGCQRLGIESVDLAGLKQQLLLLPSQHKQLNLLKIIVTRGEGTGGYSPHLQDVNPTEIIRFSSLSNDTQDFAENGIVVRLCAYRLPHNPVLAGIKHLNRLDQVMARGEWRDEVQEGLMMDHDDLVIEGTMTNLFIETPVGLKTPDLSRCGIAGVLRAHVLALCESLDIDCSVCDITLGDVRTAKALFVCNSVRGIWPVVQFEQTRYPITETTRKLQGQLRDWFVAA